MRLIQLLLFCLLFGSGAQADKRAFIVGVGEYEHLSDLRKTVGDALGYQELFEGLGFEVTLLKDPNRREFNRAFGAFIESVEEDDEVVFVFSGHGWSDGAENYLIMADAPAGGSVDELRDESRALSNRVLAPLNAKSPRLMLGIIDACRENPFDMGTRGFAPIGMMPVQAPEGMMLMFAAGDRQLALDRLGQDDEASYSVFTRTLLPLLRETDRPLQEIARDVKDDVRDLARSINHDQRPAYYDELLGDYCLSGQCRTSTTDPAQSLWEEIQDSENLTEIEAFVSKYPDSTYAAQAARQLANMKTDFSPLVGWWWSTPVSEFTVELFVDSSGSFEFFFYGDGLEESEPEPPQSFQARQVGTRIWALETESKIPTQMSLIGSDKLMFRDEVRGDLILDRGRAP